MEADGAEYDVVMKPSGPQITVEALANEMLGSFLAADLGLPVNEPFLVPLETDFVASVPDLELRRRLESACPLAFASRDAGNQWRRWHSGDRVSVSQTDLALLIVAFDAFIANNDRSPRNPNLLVKDDEWRLIDHESAFSFHLKFAPSCEPWRMGNLAIISNTGADSEHLFTSDLRGRGDLNYPEISARWLDLSDTRLAQYDASLPEEWVGVRQHFSEALSHLREVRDKIDLCVAELTRVLA